MKPKHFLFFCTLFFISSCCPSKEYFDDNFLNANTQLTKIDDDLTSIDSLTSSSSNELIKVNEKLDRLNTFCCEKEEGVNIFRKQYLKCYVIHPSNSKKFQKAIVGIYTKTKHIAPAIALNISSEYGEDSIIYIKFKRTNNNLIIEDIKHSVDENKDYVDGSPTINQLDEIYDLLVDLEGIFHPGGLPPGGGFHREGHIIVKGKESLLTVFNLCITQPPENLKSECIINTETDLYSYSFNDTLLNIGDTITTHFLLDTIGPNIFLNIVNEDHYPHPPK